MKPEEFLAKRVAGGIVQAFAEDGALWDMIDDEVLSQIQAADTEDAQIWLTARGYDGPRVCVTLFGCDDPLVVPFVIPAVFLPASPDFANQVQETREEIAALRKFASQVAAMADGAERELGKILTQHKEP